MGNCSVCKAAFGFALISLIQKKTFTVDDVSVTWQDRGSAVKYEQALQFVP